jgi:hypothetical protein
MKRSKFSEARIAFALKRVETGPSIGEACRKAGSATRKVAGHVTHGRPIRNELGCRHGSAAAKITIALRHRRDPNMATAFAQDRIAVVPGGVPNSRPPCATRQ